MARACSPKTFTASFAAFCWSGHRSSSTPEAFRRSVMSGASIVPNCLATCVQLCLLFKHDACGYNDTSLMTQRKVFSVINLATNIVHYTEPILLCIGEPPFRSVESLVLKPNLFAQYCRAPDLLRCWHQSRRLPKTFEISYQHLSVKLNNHTSHEHPLQTSNKPRSSRFHPYRQ